MYNIYIYTYTSYITCTPPVVYIYIYWLNSEPKTHQTQLRFCSAKADLA